MQYVTDVYIVTDRGEENRVQACPAATTRRGVDGAREPPVRIPCCDLILATSCALLQVVFLRILTSTAETGFRTESPSRRCSLSHRLGDHAMLEVSTVLDKAALDHMAASTAPGSPPQGLKGPVSTEMVWDAIISGNLDRLNSFLPDPSVVKMVRIAITRGGFPCIPGIPARHPMPRPRSPPSRPFRP